MFLNSKLITTKHGFFTRQGGVSPSPFTSLNCGFQHGDIEANVQTNRDIVLKQIGGNVLVTAKQTHSDVAAFVTGDGAHQADALVTNRPGVAIAVLTADCTPVLLHDPKKGVVAAIHAGWRGARFGIIGSAIRAMEHLGSIAEDIVAVIGPTIQQQSYEVSLDFVSVFLTEAPTNNEYFINSHRENHFMFDLPAYVEHKLKKNGVEKIENLHQDTLSQPEKFYSFRRKTLGDSEYGSQISVICL